MKKSKLILALTTLFSAAFMVAFITVGFLAVGLNSELPNAQKIKNIELKVPLRIYSSEGLLISEFGDERRKPVDIKDIPEILTHAVLSAEDDKFFQHRGIDLKGIVRAAIRNFTSKGGNKQGASTITQQVARNFYLTSDQTYTRKIKELFLAIRLEQILTKDEILSLYLNKIFLGHRSYGFGAAADVYYGKSLSELTTAEIAMLAGLPKAPSTFNPLRNPTRAVTRRNYVLGRLKELNFINDNEYDIAIAAPVTAKKHSIKNELSAPHIAEMVRAKLIKDYGEGVYWQGLNVTTTIRAEEQIAAEKALRRGLEKYDRRHGFRGPIAQVNIDKLINENQDTKDIEEVYNDTLKIYPSSQDQIPALITETSKDSATATTVKHGAISLSLKHASWAKKHKTQNLAGPKPSAMDKLLKAGDVVYVKQIDTKKEGEKVWGLSQIPDISGSLTSINPNTGELISLVGGYDFFLNKYNRATQSIRQPGSNIKPFIYSASLDKGFTPATLISGAPIVMRDPTHGTIWRPENYSGKFFGPTRMRTALAKSMNLVSIRLLRSIGIPYSRDYISRFGIDMSRFSSSLTMALGSGGVIPIEMLSAYGVLANGGYRIKPYFIENIADRDGNIIYEAPKATLCDECYQDYIEVENESINEGSASIASSSEDTLEDTQEPTLETASTQDLNTYQAPRVMSAANNFLTVSMLKNVVTSGTARKALALKRNDLAGKTGTTNDYVDAWFSGFNSQVATSVWVGFDKPKSLGRGEAGGVAALPIWVEYMSTALKDLPEDSGELPETIEQGWVNRNTGKRTTEDDPSAITEYFAIDKPSAIALDSLDTDQTLNLDEESNELNDPEKTTINETEYPLETEAGQPKPNQGRIIENPEDTQGLF